MNEPPHQDLHCLQIQLFLPLGLKELNHVCLLVVTSLGSRPDMQYQEQATATPICNNFLF